jgi:hypothetical protein
VNLHRLCFWDRSVFTELPNFLMSPVFILLSIA